MTTTILPTTKAVAADMVKDAAHDDPAIVGAFQFPSETEIRLIYLDTTARPYQDAEPIAVFYFGADAKRGIPYPSAVALVRPEEYKTLQPPEGWGGWERAFSVGLHRKTV